MHLNRIMLTKLIQKFKIYENNLVAMATVPMATKPILFMF